MKISTAMSASEAQYEHPQTRRFYEQKAVAEFARYLADEKLTLLDSPSRVWEFEEADWGVTTWRRWVYRVTGETL